MSTEAYLVPMAAGTAFGFGLASVAYLAIFTRALKQIHADNVETARLLVENDRHRASEVSQTAVDLSEADENLTRKVKDDG